MRIIAIPDDGVVRIPIMDGKSTVGERRIDLSNYPTVQPGWISVNDVVGKLFSHNEIVALWRLKKVDNVHYLLWRGMAWDIPREYQSMPFVKVFGTIPESIMQADTINIEIDVSEPTKEGRA